MRKFKFITLIFFVCLLFGCTVNSKITMRDDGSVEEKIIFSESISKLGNTEKEVRESLKLMIKKYEVALNSRNYKYNILIENNNGKVVITNKFDDICDYFKNTIFSQYVYKQMKWQETEEYYLIDNVTEHISYCEDCSDWPVLPKIKYSVSLPINAMENDADKVNNNTYVWLYDKNTTNNKTFHLKIDKNELRKYQKNNEIVQEKNNKIKKISNYVLIILSIILIIIIVIILVRKHNNRKIY